MAAAELNLLVEPGSTLSYVFNLQDNNGTNIDLTGCSAIYRAVANIGDAAAILQMDSYSLGGIALGGSAGTVTLSATPVQTNGINLSLLNQSLIPSVVAIDSSGNTVARVGYQAPHSLEISWPDLTTLRLFEGIAVITPRIA